MIVIHLSRCPASLKGDLSRWMFEIGPGIFVGNLSARVRDLLWDRICGSLKNGKATMVYTAQCEQRMKFRVHGTDWTPVDFDGLVLMQKPKKIQTETTESNPEEEKAIPPTPAPEDTSYIILDCETTGLDAKTDRLLEVGALKVENGVVTGQYSALIDQEKPLSGQIKRITGLTDERVHEKGRPEYKVLVEFLEFCGTMPVVGYNINFDLDFINEACLRSSLRPYTPKTVDALELAKKRLPFLPNRKLITVARHFGIEIPAVHRALADCFITLSVYQKLKEMEQ